MKYFLLVCNSLISFGAGAQSANMIVEEGNLWSTLEIHCLPQGTSYSTYYIHFDADTLIEGLVYKKIERCNDEYLESWDDYGFIRENEENRIFLRNPIDQEGMIYDFGVEPGDSLQAKNIFLNNDTLHFVVVGVDSVLLFNDYKKRIILYEYLNEKEEIWIEGLGSYYGILNSCNNAYGSACGSYEAMCYENNGTLIYQHPDYDVCFYSSLVGSGNSLAQEIKIYPNPAKQSFTVEFPNEVSSAIEVYKINGEKILEKMLTDKKVVVFLHDEDKGIYVIRFKDLIFSYPPYKLIVD